MLGSAFVYSALLHNHTEASTSYGQVSLGLRGLMNIAPLSRHMTFVDEIACLHQAEWAHLSSLLTAEARKNALKNAAGTEGIPSIYVAYKVNEFIGSAALIEHDLDTHCELGPWLAAVFVKEKWRGNGVASSLIGHCENEAKRMGVKTLYLSTQFATQLYVGLGWGTIERCQYKGVELDVMCKTLSS